MAEWVARFSFPWLALGALLLGGLLAKWSWVLFAPRTTAVAVMPEHTPSAEAGRLFGTAVANVAATTGTALPNVRLIGVFTAALGKPGFAILKLDDKRQVGVAVGETVAAGTRLAEVHADYVVLEGGGTQQRVNLEGKIQDAPKSEALQPLQPRAAAEAAAPVAAPSSGNLPDAANTEQGRMMRERAEIARRYQGPARH